MDIWKYVIEFKENGIVYIFNGSEWGDFHITDLEKSLDKFFSENF